MMWFGKYDMRG